MLSLILQIVWKVKVRKCFLKRLSSVSQKMLLLMLTFWDEFRSLIQSCILRVKVEVLIFTDAELTYFSHRIVRSSSQSPIWCCGECCPLWEAWHTHWGWCLCAPHSQCWCQTCANWKISMPDIIYYSRAIHRCPRNTRGTCPQTCLEDSELWSPKSPKTGMCDLESHTGSR